MRQSPFETVALRSAGANADTYKCDNCGDWEYFDIACEDGVTYECLLVKHGEDKLRVIIGQESDEQGRWNGYEPTCWCSSCSCVPEEELVFE